jgi:hypothetical protein
VLTELARADGGEIYLAPYPGASAMPRPSYPVARWGTPFPADEGCHMALPLRRGEQDLGRIVLWRGADGSPFADDDIAVAGAVADQLALALENRSLLARDLAALYETPAVKGAPLDLAQLTQRLLHQALTIAGVPGGAALLYDAATRPTPGCCCCRCWPATGWWAPSRSPARPAPAGIPAWRSSCRSCTPWRGGPAC